MGCRALGLEALSCRGTKRVCSNKPGSAQRLRVEINRHSTRECLGRYADTKGRGGTAAVVVVEVVVGNLDVVDKILHS